MNIRTVFFGTPEFAVESLDSLLKSGCDVAAVVTAPDKVAGRGHKLLQSDVKRYAVEHGLPVLQPVKLRDPEFLAELKALQADIFVVIAFRMLPEVVWGMPRLGTFNLHAALLPKFRGAAPINHAIMAGEKVTGVTTFFLNHDIDTGDMIMQRSVDIGDEENVGQLYDRLMHLGAEMTVETISKIAEIQESMMAENGGVIPSGEAVRERLGVRRQPEGEYTPAPKIFKETCIIDWRLPARKIHDFIRGLSPYPAAWCRMTEEKTPGEFKTMDVKILDSRVTTSETMASASIESLSAGEVKIVRNHLYVGTGDVPLEIYSLQPAGKRPMEGSEFVRGYRPLKFS